MGDINTGISEVITTEQQPASIWDGYVFTSHESDCELVINPSLDFEHWFLNQDFYTNMRFIHGDNLFSKDGDVYRVLPVQMTYVAWDSSRAKTKDDYIAVTQKWFNQGWNSRQEEFDKSINAFFDEQVGTPTAREYSNFIADLGKASRGECE